MKKSKLDLVSPVRSDGVHYSLSFMSAIPNILFSLLLTYAMLGLVWGNVSIAGSTIVHAPVALTLAAILLAVSALFGLARTLRPLQRVQSIRKLAAVNFVPELVLVGVVLLLASDYVGRRFVYSYGYELSADVLWSGLIVCLFARFVFRADALSSLARPAVVVVCQMLMAIAFYREAGAHMLFSDDHPSFIYRFQLLLDHFPAIPFYSVDWNAGVSAREFFPSGMLNIFFLALPIFAFFDLRTPEGAIGYNLVIAYIFIGFVPWFSYAAARVLGFSRQAAAIAAILALAPSLEFFRWVLRYGTIGFSFAAATIPLTFALSYRLFLGTELPRWRDVLLLLVLSFFSISWSLSFTCLVPLGLLALWNFRHITVRARLKKIIAFIALFAVVNGPWMLVFVEESKVFSFLSHSTLPGSHSSHMEAEQTVAKSSAVTVRPQPTLSKSVEQYLKKRRWVSENLVKINPAILLFAIPGFLFVGKRKEGKLLLATAGWLALLPIVIDSWKPQLELRRLFLQATFFLIPLAACGVEFLAQRLATSRHRLLVLPAFLGQVVLVGSLCSTVLVGCAAYQARLDERFIVAPPVVDALSKAIREHGGDGRVFFSAFILHDLGSTNYSSQDGGHIAPLATFTGKPLYAFDFYHARWSSVDPIPAAYRKRGDSGIEEFLDLINATAVVTHRPEWRDYCLEHPERYEPVFQDSHFRLFKRKNSSAGYFMQGEGEVQQTKEGFQVLPRSTDLLLKFRYLPRLRTSHPEHVQLIAEDMFVEELGGGRTQMVQFVRLRIAPEFVARQLPIEVGYRVSEEVQ